MRCRDITGNLISVASGAGIGALLMYLFDPEEGQARRQYLGEKSGEALQRTQETLEDSWHTMRDKASEYAQTVRSRGRDYADRAGDYTQAAAAGAASLGASLGKSASRAGRQITDSRTGRRLSRRMRNAQQEISDRLRYAAHGRESYGLESGTSQALAGLGCLVLGFGAMYFLDSQMGRRRRALVRDKFLSGFNRMATSLERTGRDLWNRSYGVVAETRALASREEVSDRVLVERVRSQIGRCVSNPSAIEVCASDGCVTLSGPVLARDMDQLMKCVWSTRGVRQIVNRLDMHQTPEDIPALQGTTEPAPYSSPEMS